MPILMIYSINSLIGIVMNESNDSSLEESDKVSGLALRGFKDPTRMLESQPTIAGMRFENIDNKIGGLEKRGFKNPIKMIESCPAILGYGFKNIDNKIKGLEKRGFEDPIKMIESCPAMLGYGFKNIDNKIKGLKGRGFVDPIRMIVFAPFIFNLKFENIDAKLEGLADRGFTNPIGIVEYLPSILGYGFENIDNKVKYLRERGFKDPIKLIESSPTILSLGLENINRKWVLIRKLTERFGYERTSAEIMEKHLNIFSAKFDKLVVLSKLASQYMTSPEIDLDFLIDRITYSNLEETMVAHYICRKKGTNDVSDLLDAIKLVKKRNFSREEKIRFILHMPVKDKVRRRYLKGYPIKTIEG